MIPHGKKYKDALIKVLKDIKIQNFIQDYIKGLHSITSQIYKHRHEVNMENSPFI